MLTTAALLLSIGAAAAALPPELGTAVTSYWDSLSSGDEYLALRHVAKGSENAFIRRREPAVQSWALSGVAPVDADRFTVTVTARCLVQGRVQEFDITENWVRQGDAWKVQIPESTGALRQLWQSSPRRPIDGTLRVSPRALKIHFLSPNQSSSILIENGLDGEVEVVRLEYDPDRFEVTPDAAAVAAGDIGRLTVRHIGPETAKNLESQIVVVTGSDTGEIAHSIPITYNFVSPAARALLGLSRQAAEELRRTDTLRPDPTSPLRERGRSAGREHEKRPNWEPER